MAPRKKQQQQPKQKQNNRKSNSTPSTSDARPSSSGPKLNISAENETRLRRLLLSSARSTPSVTPADDSLSKVQKVKKLKAVYEKLSCEGFTNDQIELALSAIGVTCFSMFFFLIILLSNILVFPSALSLYMLF